MREEVEEVLGDKQDISWEDLNRLEYLHCVFKETLRIYPVAPATVRQVTEETVVDGIRIPAGSPIVVSVACSPAARQGLFDACCSTI